MSDTTPPADGGNITEPQDNWAARYVGLQKVVATRDADLHTANGQLDSLRKEHEQALARIAEYDQQAVDASEEEQAKAQYEALKTRFEQDPPKPVGNNPQRTWADGSDDDSSWGGRDRLGIDSGFPV